MNLEELRSARATERRKDSLQHLRDSFYDDVADYVAELRDARDRRAAEVSDPFADEQVRRMTDEIETAEEVMRRACSSANGSDTSAARRSRASRSSAT